jgi:menaquinol-cytochrome c reductase iron-sulfur subunit
MAEGGPKPPHGGEDTRRDFLKVVGVGGLGLGLGAVVAAPAVAYVAFPLEHATVSGGDGFVKIGRSAQFKEGTPVKVDIFADRRDAWNRILKVKVGSAWVVRKGEKIAAFSTVCPHLGCAVDVDGEKFGCPCHKSVFTLDGKVETGPSPRGMDALEVEEKEGMVTVRYKRYRQGIAEKEVV